MKRAAALAVAAAALVLGLAYTGLAVGVAIAVPVSGGFSGSGIPAAQHHLDLVPARLLAIAANALGTLAAVGIALLTIRRRPLGNGLIVAGLAVAALGSALVGLREGGTAAVFAAAAVLLYLGFVAPLRRRLGGADHQDVRALPARPSEPTGRRTSR